MMASLIRRGLVAAGALALGVAMAAGASAQGMFYKEIVKDGRIYVFSSGAKADLFEKSGEMGVGISRFGVGPNGETVIFENEDAINLYNFKHDRPGEYFPKPKEAPKSPYPAGKITGLAFGDYYYFADHHDAKFDAQQGFWLRRAYLGYDYSFTEKYSMRLRFEMNSNGVLAGGNLNPFVKDAYLTMKLGNSKQQLRTGIQPSLTFDSEEGFWGLRHIEKTPADLYKIDSSRDFGVSFSGPVGEGGFSYGAQFGNDAGNGSETDKYKVARFIGLFEPKSGLRVEGIFNYGKRPNGQDRTTAKGLLGYKGKQFRVAGEYLWQERKSGKTEVPDLKIGIISAFAVWDFKPKKGTAFARFDSVKGDLDGTDTGLPGADTIDYLVLSNKAPFKGYIFGFEWYLHPSIRFSPNVEVFSYDDAPDGTSIDKDVVARATFYYSF